MLKLRPEENLLHLRDGIFCYYCTYIVLKLSLEVLGYMCINGLTV